MTRSADAPSEAHGVARAAVSAVAALWSAEILLARFSSEPQAPRDLLESIAVLAALGVLPAWGVVALLQPSRLRDAFVAISAAAPLSLVLYSVTIPLTVGQGRPIALGAPIAIGGGVAAWRLWRAYRAGRSVDGIAGPYAVVACVAAATAITWAAGHLGGWPPASLWAPLALGWGVAAWLASRPRRLLVLAALTVATALVPRGPTLPEFTRALRPGVGPDIVVFSVDTLRVDVASEMRSFQRIASAGVEFRNAQAAAPWTLASMGTVFTGVRPPRHGAVRFSPKGSGRIADDVPTFVEMLAASGYDTAGISTNSFLDQRRGFGRGFDWFFHSLDAYRWSLPRAASQPSARPASATMLTTLGLSGRPDSFDAGIATERALDVLHARRPERPLFLWVHYMDCHLPYRHADRADLGWSEFAALERGNGRLFRADDHWRTPAGFDSFMAGMRAEAAVVDDSISVILDELGPVPVRGRVVVFLSDHGEEFFEHGDFLHGHALYQEVLGIPLAISGLDGRAAGEVERAVVGHLDLAPTLLSAAGIDLGSFEGRDLARPIPERVLVSENLDTETPDAERAARQGRFKLIVGPDLAPRLFDLDVDPAERHSIADEHPEVVARLVDATRAPDAAADAAPRRGPVEISDEERRMLEAIGYAE